jgi:hypothetical protein
MNLGSRFSGCSAVRQRPHLGERHRLLGTNQVSFDSPFDHFIAGDTNAIDEARC